MSASCLILGAFLDVDECLANSTLFLLLTYHLSSFSSTTSLAAFHHVRHRAGYHRGASAHNSL